MDNIINIVPDFIYNRADLWDENADSFSYGNGKLAYVTIEGHVAMLWLWLTEVSFGEVKELTSDIFLRYKDVRKIHIRNLIIPIGKAKKTNHFRIVFPSTVEELSLRISKKGRYNIQRNKRLIEQEYGIVSIVDYTAQNVPTEVFETYFEFKKVTHHVNFNLTKDEYIKRYHVSNIYVLYAQNSIIAIILSCEQCPVVYIENITYDTQLARYSPGQVLYDEYLKSLVKKGKKEIFLLGGNLEYKRRYGSIEETLYDCTVYRSKARQYYDIAMEAMKKPIKKLLGRP